MTGVCCVSRCVVLLEACSCDLLMVRSPRVSPPHALYLTPRALPGYTGVLKSKGRACCNRPGHARQTWAELRLRRGHLADTEAGIVAQVEEFRGQKRVSMGIIHTDTAHCSSNDLGRVRSHKDVPMPWTPLRVTVLDPNPKLRFCTSWRPASS